MSSYKIPTLPLAKALKSSTVLDRLNLASRQLAELKGTVRTISNERILTNTLILREARQSSAVENIVTTQDELYKADITISPSVSLATKEVLRYAEALRHGFDSIRQKGVITLSIVNEIQSKLEQNNAGIRRTPGTALKNSLTGEIVYEPPQHPDDIARYLDNLLNYINDPYIDQLDPLIKMAIIHHQFESIHPYYDGNGRTGRILNILYLVQEGLLDLPILYLSGYIIKKKSDYYRYLQAVRDHGEWEAWICYMLKGVEETALHSIELVDRIRQLMQLYKRRLRQELPKVYSQDLLNNIFRHPYTKIEAVADDLHVHKNTAATYLNKLTNIGLLTKRNIGRPIYYTNDALIELLAEG